MPVKSNAQFIHVAMKRGLQNVRGVYYDGLVEYKRSSGVSGRGHEHNFFDTEAEARAFIASRPHIQYEYSYRAWSEPFLSMCCIVDHRRQLANVSH